MAYPYRKLPALTPQDINRFWSRTMPADSGCILWTGAIQHDRYANFHHSGQPWRVHRIAYFIYYGTDPGSLEVCHRCDVRHCCNPLHLFLGTQADNMQDMKSKGRSAKGDASPARLHIAERPRGDNHYAKNEPHRLARGGSHGNARFTEEDVREMRRLHADEGLSARKIAATYRTHPATVARIIRREAWAHI